MKKISLIVVFALSNLFISAQSFILVTNGTTSTIETNLDSAISHASPGDFIYLPGGIITSSSNIIIDKRINLIGCGYHPDSSIATNRTIVNAVISLAVGSDSSMLMGFDNTSGGYPKVKISASHISILSCNISGISLMLGSLSEIYISESIISAYLSVQTSGNYSNLRCSNNIFFSHIANIDNINFKNNLCFLYFNQ